ncbi:MAG TPA: hypothetical protein VLD36_20835, partial [Burkholderiales bacterium]|nr:hypothetical protein [Burkholderiales bacterium]
MTSLANTVLTRAAESVDEFERLVADVPYERKGVLFSEMLFVRAILGRLAWTRILESGRARGQSTHLLAVCFPDREIISIEKDPGSPDVPVAAARLAPFANVKLMFCDAMQRLPELMQCGDAVVIDGPKGLRAIRLALKLLRTGKPSAVFVHDCGRGTEERAFLERHMPGVLYSDAAEFVDRYGYLDARCAEADTAIVRGGAESARSYGPTFACLTPDARVDYGRLL